MLGDANGGYNYNQLLYNLDLSPTALYGGYVAVGLAIVALVWTMWGSSKHRRHS